MVSGLVDAVAVVQGETGVGAGKRGVYKQQQELVFLHMFLFCCVYARQADTVGM